MSAIVHYSFYVESTLGVPAVDLSPSFVYIKRIPDGVTIDPVTISINDLGSGLYSFSIDWSQYDDIRDDGSRSSFFVRIDTGLEVVEQKYMNMRIERQDYLPELVDNIKLSADSLTTSASALDSMVRSILEIEEGHWIIANNKLYIYNKTIAETNRTTANAMYTFALYNANGEATSQDVYQRINIHPED
jgi:hypothetical protein